MKTNKHNNSSIYDIRKSNSQLHDKHIYSYTIYINNLPNTNVRIMKQNKHNI